jgi:DNA polymerase-3 subunit gamma/tau
MENFVVSARKYRPDTFDTVVGQESVTSTLKNAIRNKHLAQAYLFCGPRGVGKTSCARILAKTINCFHLTPAIEACNTCESCISFNESRSYNIHELDAASNNSVDDIRNLIDQVRIPPQIGQYSIYIIDEVHMLSQQAFNAFLKTLEEPPKHAIFILATTEKHKILPTILSRCQVFDFNRIGLESTVNHLLSIAKREGINAEPDALSIIAQKADGGMRDALSVFDQVVSFTNGNITYKSVIDNLNILDYDYYFKLTDAFLSGDAATPLLVFDEILADGFDAQNFIQGMLRHFRDLLVTKDPVTLQLLETGENIRQRYQQQAAASPLDFLYHALDIVSACDINLRNSRNQRLLIELTLVKLTRLVSDKKKNSLVDATSDSKSDTVSASVSTSTNNSVKNSEAPKARRSGVPSLKDAMSQTQKAAQPQPTPVPEVIQAAPTTQAPDKQIDIEKANTLFASYVENLKATRPRMYSSLNHRKFEFEAPVTLWLTFGNNSQAEEFKSEISNNLTTYLRNEIQNSQLIIDVKVEQREDPNLIYTSEDKFKYMSEKNPSLIKLRQRLGLDFD